MRHKVAAKHFIHVVVLCVLGVDRSGTMTSKEGKRHTDDADHKKQGGERPESHQTDRVDSSLDDKYVCSNTTFIPSFIHPSLINSN